LGNPEWRRDSAWLVHVLVRQRDAASQEERELYDIAILAARRYPITASGTADTEAAWDEVLTAIDRVLVARQERHMEAVRAAQAEQR